MYKFIVKFCTTFLYIFCILLLYVLPTKIYKLGVGNIAGEMFPAIEIIIIYYFSTYKTMRYEILFFLGIITDVIYHIPIGTSSLAYIIANIVLVYANKWFILKDYIINILFFCIYSFFIISLRYLIFLIIYEHNFESMAVYFYYLTTIISYPLLKSLIFKMDRVLGR